MGGYAGAAVAKVGFSVIIGSGWIPTLIFIVVAPVMGFVVAFILMITVMWLFHKKSSLKVNKAFRKLQLLSAAFLSLGHGTNDAQKTMGIITGLLVTSGYLSTFHVPIWVVLSCHFAIAMGTLFGGWRIVKTMGQKITKLRPVDGFCAETAGGITLLIGTSLGIPISTTHTINGGIMGVGATNRLSAVRWGVAGNIVLVWILTIPLSALFGAGAYKLVSLFIEIRSRISANSKADSFMPYNIQCASSQFGPVPISTSTGTLSFSAVFILSATSIFQLFQFILR